MIDKALTAYCCSAGRSSWVCRNSSSRLVRRAAGRRLIRPRPQMQRAPHRTPARRESHYSAILLFNYSIIQLFHYSTFQLLHYSIIPLFHLSTAFQLFQLLHLHNSLHLSVDPCFSGPSRKHETHTGDRSHRGCLLILVFSASLPCNEGTVITLENNRFLSNCEVLYYY